MMYEAEGWTLRKSDEKKIRGAEMWFYRRLCQLDPEKKTNRNILEELGGKRQLLELVIRRKLIYFGHAY